MSPEGSLLTIPGSATTVVDYYWGEARPLYAQAVAASGSVTIGSAAFWLFDPTGSPVVDEAAATIVDLGAQIAPRMYYRLDTGAIPAPRYDHYWGAFRWTLTATDSIDRTLVEWHLVTLD